MRGGEFFKKAGDGHKFSSCIVGRCSSDVVVEGSSSSMVDGGYFVSVFVVKCHSVFMW